MLGLRYFVTGIECATGQRRNCPSLALRPKLPATADQREVRESRPLCRNRLFIGYSAAEADLATETVFWLSFRGYFRLLGDHALH